MVTAEVIEYQKCFYVRCKQENSSIYFINDYYERIYTADKLHPAVSFRDKDSATRLMEEYLDFVNTLGLPM